MGAPLIGSIAAPFAQSLTHLFGSVALLLGLVLLTQRRAGALVGAGAVQAWVAAGAAAVRGGLGGDVGLVLAALITLAASGVAIPIALTLVIRRRGVAPTPASAPGRMGLGAALVGLAALAVPAVAVAGGGQTRESLAVALAVLLLGALLVTARGSPIAQLVGMLSLGNGLILAATPGLPLVALVPLAALAPAGLLLGAIARPESSLEAGATPGARGR